MNRTDRLMAIVLELQRSDWQRAEDLAATFEVSLRTIYRDIQALSEAGVPVIAVPRKGYALTEGYFLPPLRFTVDEAFILALGSDFMATNFDAQYRIAARSAYHKIDAILPDIQRNEVDYLVRNINFFATNPLDQKTLEHLRQLRHAIAECKTVQFQYSKKVAVADEPATSIREADPYALARLANDWYLMAYCHLRQSRRIFRLARIDHLLILEKTFDRPVDLQLDWITSSSTRPVVVRVLVAHSAIRWVRESLPFSVTDQAETPTGLLLTLKVRDEHDLVQWILSWGRHIHVLEPDSLRRLLLEETEQMLRNFNSSLEILT